MQIVIDIPSSIYANLSKIVNESIASKRILDCVKNGVPLPKGHGRLIDAEEIQFENTEFETYGDYCIAFDAIDEAPTIIEADEGGEECS